jgi:mannose-6-phosphate isomerase-like protein (cupin superfamily)
MPQLIPEPILIAAAGNKPKRIEEFAGRVSTGDERLSIARMISPEGWAEPGQRPDFREYTLVLRGLLKVESEAGTLELSAGQCVVTEPGEWVRYSTPHAGGAEYLAVCLPAFSPQTVHRDAAGEESGDRS